MRVWNTLILMSAMAAAVPAQAALRAYEAPMDVARWTLEKNAAGCRLSQTIPLYGEAEFISRGGSSRIEFKLRLERGTVGGEGWAVIRAVAPLWQPGLPSRDMGAVAVQSGNQPFRLASPMAWRLLGELERGMFPTFYLNDGRYDREQVSVALSAVNFLKSYQGFLGCVEQVASERQAAAEAAAKEAAKPFDSLYDVKVPNRATVFFASASSELTPSAREVLDKVAGYIKKEPKVELVVIDGHTDSRGSDKANLRLSRERAESVKNYLVGNSGLEPNRIRTRSYGERYPAVPNDTPAGMARNRRVLLLVQTTAEPAPGSAADQIHQAVESTSAVQQATQPPAIMRPADASPSPEAPKSDGK